LATKDKSHLEWHGQQWRVTVLVPPAARAIIGKSHLKRGLKTPNLATANLLKPPVIAELKAEIEEALRHVQPFAGPLEEARAIRAARTKAPRPVRPFAFTDRLEREHAIEVEEDDEGFYATERAERLEEKAGETAAVAFADVALGKATPLAEHLEVFGADQGYQPKSLLTMQGGMKMLERWLTAKGHRQTLEAITPDIGAAFMRYLIHDRKLSPKSAGKYLSFLRSYWKWLADHRHLPPGSIPWSSALPKARNNGRHTDLEPDEGKRPYKPEELKKLLNGTPGDPNLIALIRIGALTGMRLEEIYRLRVRDVSEGFFLVRDGKTANARRRVPVHPDLVGLLERLTKGRGAGEYLVDPSAKVLEKTGLRSGAASKAFGYYRKSVGVDDRPNGKLKSNVDFHSLRRWFIMSARDALLQGATGYNQWTIAEVAGHEDGLTDTLKMTLGLYAGASGDEALRACVAAVKLP
jgi:integrase